MYIFPIIFLVLFTSSQVSSKGQHLAGDEDIFEDALLEHLRDVRDEEDDSDVYYGDEENDKGQSRELSRDQLLEVLDVIKKEAHKRRAKLKKTVHNSIEKVKRSQTVEKKQHNRITKKSQRNSVKDNNVVSQNKKKETAKGHREKLKILNIETEKKDAENNQMASVEVDDNFEKQNELINKIDLRQVLEKDGNEVPTGGPKHAHVKQEKVVSTKSNKTGLDRVSFIAVVAGCCVAAIAGIALAAYCWYKLRVETKDDTENPRQPKKTTLKKGKKIPKDEKPISKDDEMNVNAEYYNYQHAKNQIKQMGQAKPLSDKHNGEDTTDDEDDEDTVYECPGPAAPGDMKVVNPLFSDGESRHSDKASESTSHDGSPTPPNERIESVSQTNNNLP